MLSRLLRQRQRFVNPRQGLFYVLPFGFELGEQSVKEWDPILGSSTPQLPRCPLEAPHSRFHDHRDVRAPN